MGALALAGLGACASQPRAADPAGFDPSRFSPWTHEAPPYRVYPGDTLAVTVHTAQELSGDYEIGPDGRANLPLAGAVMLAGKTAPEAARAIAERYARTLRDPIVEARASGFGSQRILVGGEVSSPGLYDLPHHRIAVMEALMLAGGPSIRARRSQIAVLRRDEAGGLMMRTVDITRAERGGPADNVPLSRFDIVFAPRRGIAEVNDFIELYVRNILPIDSAFAFALANAAFSD
ncbi:polysaccharide export protein [Alkalicaulis satelles]|uniref:Polysaccharide export protein n=1 Tax=Alkalicaulis satelles TaxID=2609175 RepID=A0A5M6ZNJ8_9PROT|nr:polysaccharide export protein [Alkalicaulis satelles]